MSLCFTRIDNGASCTITRRQTFLQKDVVGILKIDINVPVMRFFKKPKSKTDICFSGGLPFQDLDSQDWSRGNRYFVRQYRVRNYKHLYSRRPMLHKD